MTKGAIEIRNVLVPTASLRDGLCGLLAETVEGGASVGFLVPMQRATAEKFWKGVFDALGSGRMLWVAMEGNAVVGSVQLDLCSRENSLHRAEVQKLFVLPSHRGRGIARLLMDQLESFARSQGRSLLVLDTLAGSDAVLVYEKMGWQPRGRDSEVCGRSVGQALPYGDLLQGSLTGDLVRVGGACDRAKP